MKLHGFAIAAALALFAGGATAALAGDDLEDGEERCPVEEEGGYVFWSGTPNFVPGETVRLLPLYTTHPTHFEDMPGDCADHVEGLDPALGSVARDDEGVLQFTVAEDAPDTVGAEFTATYAGAYEITARFNVYRPEESPLVGLWEQLASDECAPGSKVYDFHFAADGTFYVTWLPMGSRRDYTGTYEYDRSSGMLALEVTGGDYIPDDVSSGTITLDGDRMALGTLSLGSNSDGNSCSADFKRISAK